MADEHQVTLGEVYRLNLSMNQRLTDLASSMIGRNEYEAGQGRISDRFHEHDKDITALAAEMAKIKADRASDKEAVLAVERKQSELRGNRLFTIIGWVMSPILVTVVAILFSSGS